MSEDNQRESRSTVRFGDYELDPERGVLSRKGIALKLQPQPFRVLELLVARAPNIVTREELSDYVWGKGVYVDLDQSLNFCIRQIRSVLNDSASGPKFVDTLPKQGYRFIRTVVREPEKTTSQRLAATEHEPSPETVDPLPLAEPPAISSESKHLSPLASRRTFVWTAAAAAVVGGGVWLGESRRRKTRPSAINVAVPLPEGATNADSSRLLGPPVVAPDGSAIVVALTTDAVTYLFIRRLDTNRLIRMEGTAHSYGPFWSPDSQHLAFFSMGKLKRMPAVGGSAVVLCYAADPRGGSWSRNGGILFGSASEGIFQVAESGGKVTRVTQLDQADGENSHGSPVFLPDGNRFLYFARTDDPDKRGIYLESLDRGQTRRRILVADGPFALGPDPEKQTYYLLSQQTGKTAAQIFDVDRGELSGPSRILLDRTGMISVSNTGVLVIGTFAGEMSRLVWLDRTGRELGTLGTPGANEAVHLSPNDRFAMITRHDSLSGQFKIWIAALPDGLFEPFSDSNHATHPIWSPDSATVYYTDPRQRKLFRRTVSPRGAEEVELETGPGKSTYIEGISPDQRYMVAELVADTNYSEIAWTEFKANLKTNPQWHSIGASGGFGLSPSLSPDGRWLVFTSNQTGDPEIYMMAFPDGSQRRRISTKGGHKPRWRRDGKELFYVAADESMMSVEISGTSELRTGTPKRLFLANFKLHVNYDAIYDATSDGQRFLAVARENPSSDSDIQMVLNWPSLLPP